MTIQTSFYSLKHPKVNSRHPSKPKPLLRNSFCCQCLRENYSETRFAAAGRFLHAQSVFYSRQIPTLLSSIIDRSPKTFRTPSSPTGYDCQTANKMPREPGFHPAHEAQPPPTWRRRRAAQPQPYARGMDAASSPTPTTPMSSNSSSRE